MKQTIPFSHILLFAAGCALVFYAFSLPGCAARAASGARAVEVPGPVGVVCYAIEDESGKAVGGNCLWMR